MTTVIRIPALGENIKNGTIVTLLVKQGDIVAVGKSLIELETDKAVLEVPSPLAGTITEVLVHQGDRVAVGQEVFRVTPSDGVEKSADKPASVPADTPSPPVAKSASPSSDVSASPSVRRLARELGISLNDVRGSGQHGRVTLDDVRNHDQRSAAAVNRPDSPAIDNELPDFAKWGGVKREGMSAIRQKTAEHLAYCWAAIPHVTHMAKADITALDAFRQQVSSDKLKLTVTPFLVKTVAAALKRFPKFNASVDMKAKEIVYKTYYNIGIAVDTEQGLLVPVIHDADKKSITAIARELTTLADKARSRKLTIDEMQGGTFTITNLGGITGGTFTPIINAPEVAILGISRATLEPCYNNSQASPSRLMLPLCLSYDHRLIDGADGARFIQWLTEAIQQPFLLEME